MLKQLILLSILALLGACSYPKEKQITLNSSEINSFKPNEPTGVYTFAQGEWIELPIQVTNQGQPEAFAKVHLDCYSIETGKRKFHRSSSADSSGSVMIDEHITTEYKPGLYRFEINAFTKDKKPLGNVSYLIEVIK